MFKFVNAIDTSVVGEVALVGLTQSWPQSMTDTAGSATRVWLLFERVRLP